LGDAAFDTMEIYKYLLQETSFEKAYIPLKNKLKVEGIGYTVNEEGIPCCPNATVNINKNIKKINNIFPCCINISPFKINSCVIIINIMF